MSQKWCPLHRGDCWCGFWQEPPPLDSLGGGCLLQMIVCDDPSQSLPGFCHLLNQVLSISNSLLKASPAGPESQILGECVFCFSLLIFNKEIKYLRNVALKNFKHFPGGLSNSVQPALEVKSAHPNNRAPAFWFKRYCF